MITGTCKINNKPVQFLLDTGSNRTLVQASILNVDNQQVQPFQHPVYTANGQKVPIIGSKRCKIQLDSNWSCTIDVLITNSMIRECIIGMDVLLRYPRIQNTILNLKQTIEECTNDLNFSNNQHKSSFDQHEAQTDDKIVKSVNCFRQNNGSNLTKPISEEISTQINFKPLQSTPITCEISTQTINNTLKKRILTKEAPTTINIQSTQIKPRTSEASTQINIDSFSNKSITSEVSTQKDLVKDYSTAREVSIQTDLISKIDVQIQCETQKENKVPEVKNIFKNLTSDDKHLTKDLEKFKEVKEEFSELDESVTNGTPHYFDSDDEFFEDALEKSNIDLNNNNAYLVFDKIVEDFDIDGEFLCESGQSNDFNLVLNEYNQNDVDMDSKFMCESFQLEVFEKNITNEKSQIKQLVTNDFNGNSVPSFPIQCSINQSIKEKESFNSIEKAEASILNILKRLSVSSLRDLTSTTNTVVHTIKLKPGTVPLKQKERRIAHHYQAEFDKMIDDMLVAKKIQPTFTSPWASPLRLLRKKDKSLRVTVDYQHLNSVTEKIAYPFPYPEEIFSKLSKAKFFTTIDLTSGYYQVPLDQKCRSYTAFMCSKGTFEYLVMPMGITNATETFQMLMNQVLKDLINKICEVYLDDIIIYSINLEEHINHVQTVADRLQQHNLKIKLEKCKIAQQKIEYLSHVISNGHISPSQNKVKDLLKFKAPLNAKQIHSFLGLAGYYRKFIKNFPSIASPLLTAAQEKEVKWTDQCQESFDTLLNALIRDPVLKLPRFDMKFELFTDASNYGIGSVLSQNHDNFDHPVAYYSKHLSTTKLLNNRERTSVNSFINRAL